MSIRQAASAASLNRLFDGDPIKDPEAKLVAWYQSLVTRFRNGDPDVERFFKNFPQFRAIALPRSGPGLVRDPLQVVGVGEHRAGWKWAVEALERFPWPVTIDDFVEHSFIYYASPPVYVQPWAGIFHHPPNMPDFAETRMRPENFMQRRQFVESAKNLVCAIALSEYLAAWLRSRLSCPVVCVRHPSPESAPQWIPRVGGEVIELVQIGYYLRNVAAIHQIPPRPQQYERVQLRPRNRPWVDDWAGKVWHYWAEQGTRSSYPGVRDLTPVGSAAYDAILGRSVVLTEVFDASANNVVVECLARCTPIVVNRHPAVIEYLGPDYPLYFDRIEDVPDLVTWENAWAASCYLRKRDRRFLGGEAFAADVFQAVRSALKK